MIPPAGMAIAALTVMLWILWSDSVRSRKPSRMLYSVRIVLFLTMSGVLIFNMIRYPALYSAGGRVLVIAAAMVGVGGAGYFGKRIALR